MSEEMEMNLHNSELPVFAPCINGFSDLDAKEAALTAYEEAIQLDPHEPSFYYHKGHVLEQLGRVSEAQRAYAEANRLQMNS